MVPWNIFNPSRFPGESLLLLVPVDAKLVAFLILQEERPPKRDLTAPADCIWSIFLKGLYLAAAESKQITTN